MGAQKESETEKSVDRKRAERLWQLLDDIDTQSDATRGDAQLFYERTMKLVAQRYTVFSSDGHSLTPVE